MEQLWRSKYAKFLLANVEGEIAAYKEFVAKYSKHFLSYPATLLPRKINLIVAPTNLGKSTMLQSVAIECSMRGPTLFLSLEQEELEMKSQIYNKIKNLNDRDKILGFVPEDLTLTEAKDAAINSLLVRKIDTRSLGTMVDELNEMLADGIEFIVIDYLKPSVLEMGSNDRSERVEIIGSALDDVIQASAHAYLITAIQGNTSSMGKTTKEIMNASGGFISGGGNILFSAESAVMIAWADEEGPRNSLSKRQVVITKSRQAEELYKIYNIEYRGKDHVILLKEAPEELFAGAPQLVSKKR